MPQIFHPSFNTISRVSILAVVMGVVGLLVLSGAIQRSPWWTGVNVVVDQPVPFSHEHHVDGLGIDCRYCHQWVEDAAFAGIPPTETCMNCHRHIWADADMLAPVRESDRTGEPLRWNRVHNMADFVYFDHGVHVAGGIACRSCHGRVDRMPLMAQHETLYMQWCLECHRHPEPRRVPREAVFVMDEGGGEGRTPAGEQIAGPAPGNRRLTNCTACHR